MGRKVKALRDEINRLIIINNSLNHKSRDDEEDMFSYRTIIENLRKEINYYKKVLKLINKDSKILVVNELTRDNIKEYLKGDRDEHI